MSPLSPAPIPIVLSRLAEAWNTHDLEALAACLHPDYESIHPLHPERNFWGREAALRSWGAVFDAIPDLHAELLRWAMNGETVWTEWNWHGRHVAGPGFSAGGVMVFGLVAGQLAWARVYTETAQVTGPDWDGVLAEIISAQSA